MISMKQIKKFFPTLLMTAGLFLFVVVLTQLPVFISVAYAEPQSQADCPPGTTFVRGTMRDQITVDTGNILNPPANGGGSPNTCITPAPPRPTETITCPDGHKVDGVTPGLSEQDRVIVCATGSGGNARLDADCKADGGPLTKDNCGIVGYIVTFTRVLSALVGIVVVIMIAVGGLQFTMARDDPQAVAAAKGRIKNAVFALVCYLFGFALLQWLVPGGIF